MAVEAPTVFLSMKNMTQNKMEIIQTLHLPALLKVGSEKENSAVKDRLKVTQNFLEQSHQTGHLEGLGCMKRGQRNPADTKQGHFFQNGENRCSQKSNTNAYFQLNAV